MNHARLLGRLLLCTALNGCGDIWHSPTNIADMNGPGAYMLERQDMPDTVNASAGAVLRGNAARCAAAPAPAGALAVSAAEAPLPLSPGDLVRVALPGDEAPTGNYKVDSDGTIDFAGVGRLNVIGRSAGQAEADLAQKLVSLGIYRAGYAHVTLRILERDNVRVLVSGAVFGPGQVLINEHPQQPDTVRQTAEGDHAINRSLSAALAHAAGVRPDADLAHIVVDHVGQRHVVDLTGLLDGQPVNDPMLVDGDRVMVPSRHCFQAALARPTPVTPPGVRVYISNLTTPANNNAASGIGRDQTDLPYGTRLLQALFSANCVGGAKVTNADRSAVLVSVNPETGESEVIERNIESLIRRPDRNAYNPVLLPNDAIACYDSDITNLRQVMQTLGDLAVSVSVARLITPF